MAKQLANTITSFLLDEKIIELEDLEIYQFGMEQILINLNIIIWISLISVIFSLGVETLFLFVGLMPIRMVGGGYHAKTPQRCSFLTISVYGLNMLVIEIIKENISESTFLALGVITVILVFKFAPVDHVNKVLNDSEKKKVKFKSRLIVLGLVGFSIILSVILGEIGVASLSLIMGTITASISLLVGHIVRGGGKNEESEFHN